MGPVWGKALFKPRGFATILLGVSNPHGSSLITMVLAYLRWSNTQVGLLASMKKNGNLVDTIWMF